MIPQHPSKYMIHVKGDGLKEDINGIHIIAKLDIGEYAEVTGTVEQTPLRPGKLGLVAGDEIAFHYHVTSTEQVDSKDGDDVYVENGTRWENGRSITTWMNRRREQLARIYMNNDKWDVFSANAEGIITDHQQGLNERQYESWLYKHKMQETIMLVRRNRFEWEGKDMFLCRPDQIYAIKRGEEIIPMDGFILCQPPPRFTSEVSPEGLLIETAEPKGWTWLDVIVGSKYMQVFTMRGMASEYIFWGKRYLVVQEKWVNAYKTPEQMQDQLAKKFAI